MRVTLLLFTLFYFSTAKTQPPAVKFGKVSPSDLSQRIYTIDSSAHAIVIAETGSTEITGNTDGWFSLVFRRYKRVHILHKNAYDEATVNIPLYTNGKEEERLDNLKAITYNLENGKVVETKLEKENVFTEKIDRNRIIKRFTLPNVREGSIIELEYRLTSDFLFNLQPWTFQGEYPRLWSEYRLELPQFLNYVFLTQGYQPFHIKESKATQKHYTVLEANGTSSTQRYDIRANALDLKWAMKDVQGLKMENYTSSLSNHIARIEFQLSAYQEPLAPRKIMDTWPEVTRKLLEDETFGKNLFTANNWMNDILKEVLQGAGSDLQKTKKIFDYVRDNITCTSHYGINTTQPLKNVLKTRSGNISDVNLLLTAMLKEAHIKADPVILSTRPHGVTYAAYPLIDQFNYVLARVRIDSNTFFLDASRPNLGFGKLLPDCYNGHARVVNGEATAIDLKPEDLNERSITSVFISNDAQGKWIGSMNHRPDYLKSYTIRQEVGKSGKEEFFNRMGKNFGVGIKLDEMAIDSLSDHDNPVTVRCSFTLNLNNEDVLYLNPLFEEAWRDNPFKSARRFYPVEMPYTFDETYVASIEIPNGYKVDELPKQVKVKYNEQGEGMFEYLITHSGNHISLRSRVYLKRATFYPEEYEALREFFNLVVSKHKEQIVLKKK